MSSDAYDASLELQIGLLEALRPNADSEAYPLPELKPTGQKELRTFRTAVLENEWISVTLCPSLGGRILSILDKRTGIEALPFPKSILPVGGGLRGVIAPIGIQLELAAQERANGLGPVDVSLQPSQHDEDPSTVWLAESALQPLSFHLRIALPSDRAEIELEARIFNRSLESSLYNGGLSFGLVYSDAVKTDEGLLLWDTQRRAGISIRSDDLIASGGG